MTSTRILILACLVVAIPCFAADTYRLNIEPQPLSKALQQFAQQSGLQVVYYGKVTDGYQADGVVGNLTAVQALTKLLAGTGLRFETVDQNTFAISSTKDAPTSDAERTSAVALGEGIALRMAQADVSSSSQGAESDPSSGAAAEQGLELEEVVVTGTHIRGTAPVGSSLLVIGREEIQASGHGRLQDFLETLPQNFAGSASEDTSSDPGTANLTKGQAIDLRGLGASSTLVLVNGSRQPSGGVEGAYVDISTIALSAIERIEILTDGASALYGSDAVGGVVNFILRKDYEGFETTARWATTDSHAEELQASMLGGKNWSGGNLLVGYQYSDRDPLMNADTPYGALNQDFRALGGSDFRSGPGVPGLIYDPGTFLPAFSIPTGQDGTHLQLADLLPGQTNFQDYVTGIPALPEQRQHSAFFALSYDLASGINVFAQGRYSRRHMTSPFAEPVAFGLPVTDANPFYVNPFPTDTVFVGYNFRNEFGGDLEISDSVTETYSATVGGFAKLPREWGLNIAATYGRERDAYVLLNEWDGAAVFAALSDTNPATALNVFGDGLANNPATIATLRADPSKAQGISTIRSLTAIADGPLLSLPAGIVKLAAGLDYRDEQLDARVHFLTPVGDLDREVAAVFGEVVVPLIGSKLALALAGRYEDYSDFGTTFNPKIGLRYTPLASLTLRGTWGTSFRAPRFNELSDVRNAPGAFVFQGLPDPQSPTATSDVLFVFGADSDLQPETAHIWTTGFDFLPTRLPGFSLSSTYFDIDYEDKVEEAGEGFLTLLFEDEWASIITRDPTPGQIQEVCDRPGFQGICPVSVAAIIDGRLRNIAGVRARGIDIDARYRRELRLGELDLALAGTYFSAYDRASSPTAPFVSVVDTVDHPLALRWRMSAGWHFKGWRVNGSANYLNDYRDRANDRSVPSWLTFDLSVGYRPVGWLAGTDFQLSAINLADREPPFVNNIFGYDASNAGQAGRSISLSIRKSWATL